MGSSLKPGLRFSTMQCTALLCTALNYTQLQCTALLFTALRFTALHNTSLHCTTLHYTALKIGTVCVIYEAWLSLIVCKKPHRLLYTHKGLETNNICLLFFSDYQLLASLLFSAISIGQTPYFCKTKIIIMEFAFFFAKPPKLCMTKRIIM